MDADLLDFLISRQMTPSKYTAIEAMTELAAIARHKRLPPQRQQPRVPLSLETLPECKNRTA